MTKNAFMSLDMMSLRLERGRRGHSQLKIPTLKI